MTVNEIIKEMRLLAGSIVQGTEQVSMAARPQAAKAMEIMALQEQRDALKQAALDVWGLVAYLKGDDDA